MREPWFRKPRSPLYAVPTAVAIMLLAACATPNSAEQRLSSLNLQIDVAEERLAILQSRADDISRNDGLDAPEDCGQFGPQIADDHSPRRAIHLVQSKAQRLRRPFTSR